MIYLSRLLLDGRNQEVRRDLANCHDLHRTILRGFPSVDDARGEARAAYGVLYRIEQTPAPRGIALLIQSSYLPDWSALPPRYLLDTSGHPPNPHTKPVGHLYETIRNGTEFVFRLHANPTKRVGGHNPDVDTKWRGKRVELRRDADLIAWLERKGEDGGFRLLDVATQHAPTSSEVVDVQTTRAGNLVGYRAGRHLTFGSVIFQGRLVVTDAQGFHQTLAQGVGSGKAYGFGLLSIGPIQPGGA